MKHGHFRVSEVLHNSVLSDHFDDMGMGVDKLNSSTVNSVTGKNENELSMRLCFYQDGVEKKRFRQENNAVVITFS